MKTSGSAKLIHHIDLDSWPYIGLEVGFLCWTTTLNRRRWGVQVTSQKSEGNQAQQKMRFDSQKSTELTMSNLHQNFVDIAIDIPISKWIVRVESIVAIPLLSPFCQRDLQMGAEMVSAELLGSCIIAPIRRGYESALESDS